MSDNPTPLSVSIENDEIVVRMGIAHLDGNAYHPDIPRLPITDCEAWSKSVAYALTKESQDGVTLPSQMFDDAMRRALDDGAQGIDYKRPTQRDADGMPSRQNADVAQMFMAAAAALDLLKSLIAEIIEAECCTTDYFPEWEAKARRLAGLVDSDNPGIFVRGDAEYCAQCGGYIRLTCDGFGHHECPECNSHNNKNKFLPPAAIPA